VLRLVELLALEWLYPVTDEAGNNYVQDPAQRTLADSLQPTRTRPSGLLNSVIRTLNDTGKT
jgi:hypothetical protein